MQKAHNAQKQHCPLFYSAPKSKSATSATMSMTKTAVCWKMNRPKTNVARIAMN